MNLSTKLLLTFGLLLALFSGVTVLNHNLSNSVRDDTNWLATSEIVIRQSNQLQRLIVEMESGLRGFLLTDREEFLEPYRIAVYQRNDRYAELDDLIRPNKQQLEHLHNIKNLEEKWRKDFAEPLITTKRKSREDTASMSMLNQLYETQLRVGSGKRRMDQIRDIFKDFNAYEYNVREQRRKDLEENIKYTQRLSWIISGLSFLLAMVGAFFITHQITTRINNMVNLAETIASGNYKIQIPDKDDDELGRLAQALNDMTRTIDASFSELARKNKELDQFAYVVSHDLKAPLRGIENASRWVEEDMPNDLPSQIKSYLHMMRGRVHRMENLINGILQLARIGRVNQNREMVDLRELLIEIVDLLQPPPTFTITWADNLPVLYTIRVEIEQVFSNLVSNAIKYHDKFNGNIAINYRDLGDFFEFSVKDDGPGIEKEYHEKIFVIFQTLHERDTIESTGVGLAIVKKIVERQGGTIRLESSPGEGSNFIFTWPKEPEKVEAQTVKKQTKLPLTQTND